MAYIPTPGNKPREIPKEVAKEISRQQSSSAVETAKQPIAKEPIPKEAIRKKEVSKKDFREKSARTEGLSFQKHGARTFLLVFLFFVMLVFAVFNYIKLNEFKSTFSVQLDALKIKSEERYQSLNTMILEDRSYLGPNGIMDKYIAASNLIDSQLIGVQDILALSESASFDKVGFMRFFINGSKPVWVSVKSSNGKIMFTKTLSPGLSKEMIYYFKKPAQTIADITIEVTQNFEVNTGNFENTYLIFFSFGVTKIVRMDSKTVSNPIQKFSIWLPGNT